MGVYFNPSTHQPNRSSTMTPQTYPVQQAIKLMETGVCDFPITMQDVGHRLARSDGFGVALMRSSNGDNKLLDMLIISAAISLCKDFDNAA